MIITQTPFRMSFFGGGTDMESFFKEHGGSVLSTTFDKYCYVNVRHLEKITDVYGAFLRHIMLKAKTAEGINERLKVCDNFSVKTMDLAESAYTWQDLQDSDFDAVIIGSDVVWAQGNGKIGRIRFVYKKHWGQTP